MELNNVGPVPGREGVDARGGRDNARDRGFRVIARGDIPDVIVVVIDGVYTDGS